VKWIVQSQIVRNLAAQNDATVVLAFSHFYAGRLARGRGRLFVIQTEHSKGGIHMEDFALRHRGDLHYHVLRRLACEALRQADRVVFPSQGAARLYADQNPEFFAGLRDRHSVVYSGIPDLLGDGRDRVNWAPDAGPLTIFNVAHHVPEKGIDLAIEGLAAWKGRNGNRRDVRFVNCGRETSETQRLVQLSQRLGKSLR
jgi:glycosyltransferase involved in cell wall biosynthesis